jgi:hypothetical protein
MGIARLRLTDRQISVKILCGSSGIFGASPGNQSSKKSTVRTGQPRNP